MASWLETASGSSAFRRSILIATYSSDGKMIVCLAVN
jgi:hypothetical protein